MNTSKTVQGFAAFSAELERLAAENLKRWRRPEGCTCNGGEGAKWRFAIHDEIELEVHRDCEAHAALWRNL